MEKTRLLTITFLFIILLFSGCMSMVEKIGRSLDGTNSANKQLALYRSTMPSDFSGVEISIVENKANDKSILINVTKFPMLNIRATYPELDEKIHLISLEYLSGSPQGWNEYILPVLGEGVFFINNDSSVISITGEIETVQIETGRIQRHDSRISGDEALTALRNRHERILTLAAWMSEQHPVAFKDIKAFSNYWKPVLFPEQVSKRKRPLEWLQEGDVFQRAEDIKWNTGYTQRMFPEELRSIRDSGTLLRDWEEALFWIHIEYEWNYIQEFLSGNINLRKIK